MSLIANSEKCVKLLVDNLLWGNVSINWDKIPPEKKDDGKMTEALAKYAINYDIINDKHEYIEMIGSLYQLFLAGRFTNAIIGELRDREEEASIQHITDQNKHLNEMLKNQSTESELLKKENKRLHEENITLANELEDLKNIVNSYEHASLKK